jgi:hypothetical protein
LRHYKNKNIERHTRGCRGRDRMVVGFTTTYAISAYYRFEFESCSGNVCLTQHYVINLSVPCDRLVVSIFAVFLFFNIFYVSLQETMKNFPQKWTYSRWEKPKTQSRSVVSIVYYRACSFYMYVCKFLISLHVYTRLEIFNCPVCF